jgi:hypothetical protein
MKARTKMEIAELFEDAAIYENRFFDNYTDLISSYGIDHDAWEKFMLEDVLDTMEKIATSAKNGVLMMTGPQIAAVLATHCRLSFRAGLLIGSEKIGE